MSSSARLYAATGTSVARLDETPRGWAVESSLPGSSARCLALDPADPDTLRQSGNSVDGIEWLLETPSQSR